MAIITRDLGSFVLTYSFGRSNDTILGARADYGDWDDWPEDAPRNIIYAGGGDDRVIAGFGDDIVYGGTGNDIISGFGTGGPTPSAALAIANRDERDILHGGSGDDTISGGGGKDWLFGGTGHDELRGGAGDDRIFGGTGNDEIWGGGGKDTLWGGAGADTFVLALAAGTPDFASPGSPYDTVMDFRPGRDKLDISDFGITADNETLAFTQENGGLTVSFDFYSSTPGIFLAGVSAISNSDIIFAG
ncbi:calcium-binding protein [Pseudoroseomonas globiformis]|uniref:Calcium-binding protein n=1 Tax=Teichococcus globiformis TaxID=2307229 RepID=A0ABV7FZW8_9PROT